MRAQTACRNISTDPPPSRPMLSPDRATPLARCGQRISTAQTVRQAMGRMAGGAGIGATVGLLSGPVLGAGCGLLFFPALLAVDLAQRLFIGNWESASGGWESLAGLMFLLPIAAVIGAVIGVVPGVVIGMPVGAIAALLRGRRTSAVVCAVLGAALSLPFIGIFPFAGALFVLSGAIGGWGVAVAVGREGRCRAFMMRQRS